MPPLSPQRMIDTLAVAKTRFPGLPNSLDALCRRFAIDLAQRTTHNALLDCRLLAEVHLELIGGRQRGLTLEQESAGGRTYVSYAVPAARTPRLIEPSEAELARHRAFIAGLSGSLWHAE
jgi:DNA polymerase-3 subunit epsilon